jgi:hypothetical protein
MVQFAPEVRNLLSWTDKKGKTNDSVTAGAMYALSVIGDKSAVPDLISYLDRKKTKNDALRSMAAGALRPLADPRAIEPLLALVDDRDESVRTQVTHGLMPFDDNPRVHKALLRMLKDEDPRVRQNACVALAMQGRREDGHAIEKLRDDEYDTVRLNAGLAVDALKSGTRDGRLAWQMERFTGIKPVDARSELNDLTQMLIGIVTETSRGAGRDNGEWQWVVTQRRMVKIEWRTPTEGTYSSGVYRTNKGRVFS